MKRQIRVVHIGKYYPPERGGMETHVATLCQGLRGHVDVRVLAANTTTKTERHARDGVHVVRTARWCEAMSTPVCPSLARHIRESRPDLVHLHWPNPMAALALLASKFDGPVVITYHSDVIRQQLAATAFGPVLRAVLARCQAIVATSELYIDSSPILSQYRHLCSVVPLGIPDDFFQKPDPKTVRVIRDAYGSPLILSVGRLVYYKGFEYLIRAMTTVNAKLLIVGDGPLKPSLLQLRRTLGLENKVFFLGNPPEDVLRACYSEAQVFALASIARSEAFGIVQIEAMAAGTPVVNTNLLSGVPFVSVHGLTGLTVEPKDANALSAGISTLLESRSLRQQYGENARRRAEAMFSAKVMVKKTLSVYREAMRAVGRQWPEPLVRVASTAV